jgi:hypothetical protein
MVNRFSPTSQAEFDALWAQHAADPAAIFTLRHGPGFKITATEPNQATVVVKDTCYVWVSGPARNIWIRDLAAASVGVAHPDVASRPRFDVRDHGTVSGINLVADLYGYGRATVSGRSYVAAHEHSAAAVYQETQADGWDDAHLFAYDNTDVRAHTRARVEAYDHAHVSLTDQASGSIHDYAGVDALDHAIVAVYDHGHLRAFDESQVTLRDEAIASVDSNLVTVTDRREPTLTQTDPDSPNPATAIGLSLT